MMNASASRPPGSDRFRERAAIAKWLSLPWHTWRSVSLHGAWRMWQRNFTVYTRIWRTALVPNFLEPLLYLTAMGYGLGRFVEEIEGVPYVMYVGSGLVAASAMMGASFEGTYNVFVKLRFQKTYDAVRATPLNEDDIALGELLWAGTRSTIYGTAFLAILALLGVVQSPAAAFLPVVFFITGFLFASLAVCYTSLIHDIDLFSFYFTLFITPMFLFSGIFFPLNEWPLWAQRLAWMTPLYHVVRVCRGFILGQPLEAFGDSLLWIVVVAVVISWIPIRLFRRRLIG